MKALIKGLAIIFMLGGSFWVMQKHQPDMSIVYPDNCTFTIDGQLSKSEQYKIKHFIDSKYRADKDPHGLLSDIETQFRVIKSINIDMNNPESLQFTVKAYHPLFVLNGSQVVCQSGHLFDKETFSQSVTDSLEDVSFKLPQGKTDLAKLALFVESLSTEILQKFSIRWLGKHQVWLDQKEGKQLSLLVNYAVAPTLGDVEQCHQIKDQMHSSNKQRKDITWVCDLRFGRQVVVFSTKKGE